MFTQEQIEKYMLEALEEAKKAFKDDEVPVGCVFVDNKTHSIIARSHNLTNRMKNASRHC